MIHVPMLGEVVSAEIGDDYILTFDSRGLPIGEMHAIADMVTLCLTDDDGGKELLAARLRGVRTKRNELLTACDWTQMRDVPMTAECQEAWLAYRQALRDMPEQVTTETIFSIRWPLNPSF